MLSSVSTEKFWKGGRVVECAGLEIRCAGLPYRGFKSHPFRQFIVLEKLDS